MTVGVPQGDQNAAILQSNINALNTKLGVTTGALQKEHMKVKLDQYQRELVYHYLDTGRLTAASILSTMS